VLALAGELGAGKTQLAKGIGAGLGYSPNALASPTFTIANHYPLEGGGSLVHIDAFRLEDAAELLATGFDDALEAGNLVVVEWPERVEAALPEDRVAISLRIERREGAEGLVGAPRIGDAPAPLGSARTAELRALGCEAARVARRLRDELAALPDVSRCERESRVSEE